MDGGDWWDPERSDTSPDYIPKPNLGGCVEAAHRHGFRVLLYVAVHLCSLDYPLYPHLRQYQYRDPWTGELRGQCLDRSCVKPLFPVAHISPASSEWRNLLIGKLKPVWEEYDIDGFHLDASHAVINDGNGLIDGLNLAQGMVLLHKELTEAMPGTIFSGERLHEATFAYEGFAQRPLMRGLTPHLISTFLFSPFVHAIGFSSFFPDQDPILHNEMVRYNEFVGAIPVLVIEGECYLSDEYVEVHKVLELARGWQHEYGLNADVNGDGQVDILDLTLVGQNVGVPFALPQADVDGDGLVNVLDMILVSNMFEGITTAR
jgi:hypothetical protein